MIDIDARGKAAEVARHFASGQLSNFEFENAIPVTKDPAIHAIEDTFWCLYDDFKEHKINDGWEIPKEFKTMMARWVMFLHTTEEYLWPDISHPGLRPFDIGFIGKVFKKDKKQEEFMKYGDFCVWPFISNESYEIAKSNPRLLKALTKGSEPFKVLPIV